MDVETLNCLMGFAGGVFAEGLCVYKITRDRPRLPANMRTKIYWLMSFFMCFCGAGLVFAYIISGVTMVPFLAMNIGATAPYIIGNLTKHDMAADIS